MLIYDWEIFKHDCLLGILNIETDEVTQLWSIGDIKKYIRDNLGEVWVRI